MRPSRLPSFFLGIAMTTSMAAAACSAESGDANTQVGGTGAGGAAGTTAPGGAAGKGGTTSVGSAGGGSAGEGSAGASGGGGAPAMCLDGLSGIWKPETYPAYMQIDACQVTLFCDLDKGHHTTGYVNDDTLVLS